MQYPKLLGLLATTARENLAKEIVIVTQSVLDKTHNATCKESISKKKKGTFLMCTKKRKKKEKTGEGFHKVL